MDVYCGLGSNIGRKKHNLTRAIRLIKDVPGVRVKDVSPCYRSAPMYYTDQPSFLNMVIRLDAGIGPKDLFTALKNIEHSMGRKTRVRYGPRIMDIDILLYGKKVINTPWLQIPHKRMHERTFVMRPLLDIAPGLTHPVGKKKFRTLYRDILKMRISKINGTKKTHHEK